MEGLPHKSKVRFRKHVEILWYRSWLVPVKLPVCSLPLKPVWDTAE